VTNPLKNDCENANTYANVVYTWWSWHICKGEGVGVNLDQLGGERKVFRCAPNYVMALGLEYCIDSLCF